MRYQSEEMEAKVFHEYEENCLLFKFRNKFTEEASEKACLFWESEFEKRDLDHKISLIWDCTEMSGFELNAQKRWVKCMNKHASQIQRVMVISDNIVIRGAARLILQAFSYESKVVKSYKELDLPVYSN
ncbi:hypothetical protein N6H18_14905 [Reichenbachiella agarivorans]|uniref:Uncharacterized protein n=1 Tax=Reichenbachiella agarivorans TaxID=2979464 RepID=A0ABY6CMA7_9BACT|nr:STAS/SEC14 domain-containing protein [Reichenbachiella agarivorans]UXP31636.1 hypothetical protein N6H18_14905 [Reichenbachiella agarivorans]